jgi:hypothetical protein
MLNVAPGKADVVEVTFSPMGEFVTSLIALAPRVDGLVESLEKARNMMICHLLVSESGHF